MKQNSRTDNENGIPSVYQRSVIIELLRLRDGMREHFKPVLHKYKISDQYWRILKTIAERGPSEITVISVEAVVPLASLSRILKKMETAGYVSRLSDPDDLRRSPIILTPNGQRIYEQMKPLIQGIYDGLSEQIGSDLILELEDIVSRANDRLERIAAVKSENSQHQ